MKIDRKFDDSVNPRYGGVGRATFKAEIEENAGRITEWLVCNSVEFEQNGVSEHSLTRRGQ